MKTRKDPVIDEIRAVRMKISAEFGHDTHKLCAFLRDQEKEHAHRLIKPAGGNDGGLPRKKHKASATFK